MKLKSKLLIIAGSDSSGGAGIQADIKTATALGVYAMTAITAITAQNTTGVKSIVSIPPREIFNQISFSVQDIKPNSVKIGMLHNVGVIKEVIKAIKNNIAIYAIHTNYDNVLTGVNAKICERLGLTDVRILAPKKGLLKKLVTFIPHQYYEEVSSAVYAAGAGNIGNYSETGFGTPGMGTFKGNAASKPVIGKAGEKEHVEEVRFETIYPANIEGKVVAALLQAHPYEEVAYDLIALDNYYSNVGSGMVGNLKKPVDGLSFLKSVKKSLKTDCIRYTAILDKPVERVAVCGGAGRFLLNSAIGAGADVFITGDFKYHDFFDADGKITVADVGHFESEQFTKDLLAEQISKKFPTFAALISNISTNPIKYL
mgnify:CR=1 FL=1